MIEKIFSFKKGSKVKVCKQVRDQKVWKEVTSVTIEQRDKQRVFLSLFLTASFL